MPKLRPTTLQASGCVVEMQNGWQDNFIDRIEYYKSKLVVSQAKKDVWDFKLDKVYLISMINFSLERTAYNPEQYKTVVQSVDTTADPWKVWDSKIISIYLELPKLRKLIAKGKPLEDRYDKWVYYTGDVKQIAERIEDSEDPIFRKLLFVTEVAKLNAQERFEYEASQKRLWDDYARVSSAEKKGYAEGRQEEKFEIAKNLLLQGIELNLISQATGLSEEELKELRKS